MTSTRKYEVGCSGSGWGIWDNETGEKVIGFCGRRSARYEALCYLYYLNGWNWQRSKYVREQPWLASIPEDIKKIYGYEITNDNQ